MNNTLRISLMGLVGAAAGFALQGCFAPQPLPECNVTVSSAAFGLTPYYVRLENPTGGSMCTPIDHLYAGMQRYRDQPLGGNFTLGVRASPVVDPLIGSNYSADVDAYNNCSHEEDCLGEEDPVNGCVNLVEDGGVELFDGTPVTVADDVGTVDLADGGSYEVDPANECMSVPDSISRVDPADPEGKKVIALGKLPTLPTDGVCAITEWEAGSGVQNFGEEMLELVDGGTETLPATTYGVQWQDFKIYNNAKVPGTAFSAKVTVTEEGCSTTYDALGVFPAVDCTTDEDCNPSSNLDAGRPLGSGISPEFKPTCDTSRGICFPSVDVTTLK